MENFRTLHSQKYLKITNINGFIILRNRVLRKMDDWTADLKSNIIN